MVATQLDLKIEQGADFAFTVKYIDDAGAPINLTDYTAKMKIRPSKDSDLLLAEYTTTNSKIVITGATGTVAVREIAANTLLYNWVAGVYDLVLIPSALAPTQLAVRILEGNVVMSREVSL